MVRRWRKLWEDLLGRTVGCVVVAELEGGFEESAFGFVTNLTVFAIGCLFGECVGIDADARKKVGGKEGGEVPFAEEVEKVGI